MTEPETVGLIPVFKKGEEVAAWAIVDESTFAWVKQRRYHLSQGYAMYGFRLKSGPKRAGTTQRPMLRCSMHRDLMLVGYGDKRVVDHINGDRLDNRLANLRVLTLGENGQNKPAYKDSTSKYRGVSWYPPKEMWRVQVMVNGRRTLIGYFDDEDEAGAAAQVFYEANVPYRRQESATARPRIDVITAVGPRVDNSSDQVEPHLITVPTELKGNTHGDANFEQRRRYSERRLPRTGSRAVEHRHLHARPDRA